MTQEEKAKSYDKALKVIKECNPDENGFITIYPQEIFPELKESEDEKIRKEIILHFRDKKEKLENMKEYSNPNNFPFDEMRLCQNAITWLEKQGKNEQKFNSIIQIPDGCHAYIKDRKVYIENYIK